MRELCFDEILIVSGGVDEPELVVTAQEYKPHEITKDWCGGNDWSLITPDFYRGVYLGKICKTHDQEYAELSPVSKLEADHYFYIGIIQTLEKSGISRFEAHSVASTYFAGVRIFGGSHFEGSVQ
jgi:hypothetical protein